MLNSKEFVRELQLRHESAWMNPNVGSADAALAALPLTRTDVDDAEARLERFAPFIKKVFPETAADRGLIESPLTEIENMRAWLNENEGAQLAGKLFLKRDSDLPVAGSVKARGGCYAVLKHTEDLALANRLVEMRDDYSVFATRAFRDFFSQYELHVGSTGNLGLSIGIMGAALGYRVTVHMSADARQWKKDLLRAKGITVLEYGADYSYAVQKGRERAAEDPRSYFIDDENSVDLFLGYAVAARRLKAQLAEQDVTVDDEHPLLVYIPCGVGGAPGGICFGLKQEFGDAAHVYFAEPVEAPCMLLGLASGLQNEICVQDIGLTGRTAADGLAVSRPSGFVGETVKAIVSGGFTVSDERADKRRKRFRTLRRDRVPGAQIGIVHALLRILRACKDVVRELVAELAVFLVQLADGILRARKEQLDDLRVFHRAAPPFLVKKCFYLNRRNFRQNASRNRKIFLFFLFDGKTG